MPKRETSYQRLKRERDEFRRQVHVLVCEPDSEEARTISLMEIMRDGLERQHWAGSYDPNSKPA